MDTEALDGLVNEKNWHDGIGGALIFAATVLGDGWLDKAATELAELRAENTEMQETLADLVVMIADFAHLLPQGAKIAFENAAAVLAKHPEEKK